MLENAELIVEFRTTNYVHYCDYRLFPSSISIGGRSGFVTEYEAQLPLNNIRPDYDRIRYLHPSCVRAGVLSCILVILLVAMLYSFAMSVTSTGVMVMCIAVLLSLLWAALHFRLVTVFRFYSISGHRAFTVIPLGRSDTGCEQFVQRLVSRIRNATANNASATESSSEPRLQGPNAIESESDLIANFRWAGVFAFGECQLFESHISVHSGRRLKYASDVTYLLADLSPAYSTIRYRRRTFGWTLLTIAIMLCFWWCAASGRPFNAPLTITMTSLVIGAVCFAIMQFKLITAYHFSRRSGVHAFSVLAMGDARAECERFVNQVVLRIKESQGQRG